MKPRPLRRLLPAWFRSSVPVVAVVAILVGATYSRAQTDYPASLRDEQALLEPLWTGGSLTRASVDGFNDGRYFFASRNPAGFLLLTFTKAGDTLRDVNLRIKPCASCQTTVVQCPATTLVADAGTTACRTPNGKITPVEFKGRAGRIGEQNYFAADAVLLPVYEALQSKLPTFGAGQTHRWARDYVNLKTYELAQREASERKALEAKPVVPPPPPPAVTEAPAPPPELPQSLPPPPKARPVAKPVPKPAVTAGTASAPPSPAKPAESAATGDSAATPAADEKPPPAALAAQAPAPVAPAVPATAELIEQQRRQIEQLAAIQQELKKDLDAAREQRTAAATATPEPVARDDDWMTAFRLYRESPSASSFVATCRASAWANDYMDRAESLADQRTRRQNMAVSCGCYWINDRMGRPVRGVPRARLDEIVKWLDLPLREREPSDISRLANAYVERCGKEMPAPVRIELIESAMEAQK